jgi:esterase/lipase superfamily enzyme
LQYGVVYVSIPHDHRVGLLESPRRWLLQREDPARHVVLLRLSVFDRAQFAAELKAAIGQTTGREALLFVHGYNVSFEDAARRTAQICYDLQFEGAAALYSWPSEGSTLRYLVDENNVRWTVPHFTEFLRLMLTETGASRVHVIAHSMGNRAVAECLRGLDLRALPREAAQLRHIVFAAPDIDADTFRDLAGEFRQFADPATRFTLYASSKDKALKASQTLSKYPRAGESGDGIVLAEGIDTIDASNVDTSLMGHSYIGDNQSILADVFDLVTRGDPPEKRFRLRPKKRAGLRYWLFAP